MVQITIDTDKDSPEHIKKLIEFLQSIVGSPSEPAPQYTVPEGDVFSVFDTPKQTEVKTSEVSYSTSDLLNQAEPSQDEEASDKDFFSLMEY